MPMPFPIDHDLHCHTRLSACSADPGQTAERLLAHAAANGYTLQGVTDHLWDPLVPGASAWYAPQDIELIKKNLPLPEGGGVRMLFGCETEFCGGTKLALSPEHYDLFDFIVVPPDHFHMKGLVRPAACDTEEKAADLLVTRLEEITRLGLPWTRTGIAHMTCSLVFSEGDQYRVYDSVDELRFRRVMAKFARLGAGIEINLSSFPDGWEEHEPSALALYRMAKEEGCRFYLASDAHHPRELDFVPARAPAVVRRLGLTAADLFVPSR